MDQIRWRGILDELRPYIFKVYTPDSQGTGFLLRNSREICGVATANHVVQHAVDWREPIRLRHEQSRKEIWLSHSDRGVSTHRNLDLAFITFAPPKEIDLPKHDLPLITEDRHTKQAVEIAWCGYPAVALDTLCFFHGYVSAWVENENAYLVDGVAINGVSGGPAFKKDKDNKFIVIGIVTQYIPNRATGETLPGVCYVVDVSPFHDRLNSMETIKGKI